MADPAILTPDSMRAEKRAVAGNSVVAAIGITALKVVVGISTGSLGILSEAAHSGLDLIAALISCPWCTSWRGTWSARWRTCSRCGCAWLYHRDLFALLFELVP